MMIIDTSCYGCGSVRVFEDWKNLDQSGETMDGHKLSKQPHTVIILSKRLRPLLFATSILMGTVPSNS